MPATDPRDEDGTRGAEALACEALCACEAARASGFDATAQAFARLAVAFGGLSPDDNGEGEPARRLR
ncbi:hypothetical protein [Celeribacter indicus]|uniref:Uncharacterized protein n=1 Tax=Celeribacter indicus TaxID=1208324 RepID=A0A0B5E0P9_9RHOB|nr:hypothetical protein [Celeribacter indicus]AJE48844.1 hypothetical protein P73_4129 [Celeribacter indicus]SDW38921.1 hypothetical protein SAMN05443573_10349 [Celeribacter indicus]